MKPHRFTWFLAAGTSTAFEIPFPSCAECLPASVHDAPGIGFGLSWSYGTAAAHFHNGTVINIAMVPGTPDYIALMERLPTLPKPPPLNWLQKTQRSINKWLGYPATRDVGTLAQMLASLRDATALRIPGPLDRVAISQPPHPGLADYDLIDALEYVNLRSWLDPNLPRPKLEIPGTPEAGEYPTKLTEAHAVFAAHKQGLCKNYKDFNACQAEEHEMMQLTVMVAGLSRPDMWTEVVRLDAPFGAFQDDDVLDRSAYLGIGLDSLEAFESPETYWEVIRDQLEMQLRYTKVHMIMLTGENGTHPDFRDAARRAVEENGVSRLQSSKDIHGYANWPKYVYNSWSMLLMDGEGDIVTPTFASARGAAQYARWRQEAPIGCREVEKCSEERKKERKKEKVPEGNDGVDL